MPLPQENRCTLADVLAWEGQERMELISGSPVMMAPPSRVHQKISIALARQLSNYLDGKRCEVYAAPFAVRLFEENRDRPMDADTMVAPDITVVCDPAKLDDIGCRGAPDLVMESLSPSTQRHDRLTKFNLYQQAGVREYWIVDPVSRSVQVFLLEDGRYSAKDFGTAWETVRVNVLEDCVIDLTQVFAE